MAGHDELMRRRGELVARSRRLRMQWGEQAQALRTPFAVADQARAGAQWLLRNPQWPLGVLAVLLIVRPRRVFKLAGTVWWGWSAYRRVRRIFAPTRLR